MKLYGDSKNSVQVSGVESGCTPRISIEPCNFHKTTYSIQSSIKILKNRLSWELPYTNNLVLIAESLESTLKFREWGGNMESSCIKINIGKMKMMINSEDRAPVSRSGVRSCVVCKRDVGSYSNLMDCM